MTRPLYLAYLTAMTLRPPEAIRLAAKLGFVGIGVRIAPVAPGGPYSPLIEDKALFAETRAAIEDTGVGVFDVEIVRFSETFRVEQTKPFLETCAALGARAVLVAGDDPDEGRLTTSFAAFCEAAAPYGLTADLEFMPWTNVPNVSAARHIVEGAGAANGRVLVDALHFGRSASTLDDVAALPAAMLGYAQICDAPAEIPKSVEGLIHTARVERYLPGDGGIDLVGLFARLPATLPVSVEVPNAKGVERYGAEEWARRALVAAQAVLARTTPR